MRQKANKPSSAERARLRAIRSVDLNDARPTFDRICRTAQRLGKARYVQVSIVGAGCVFVAGATGAPVETAPREHSITIHALESDGVLWLEDLSADRRFDANPYVHGELGLRFYAGAPVVLSDGSRIGALLLMDITPRAYEADIASALEDLAALVAHEWERQAAMKALRASDRKVRAANQVLAGVVDNAPMALLMTDRRMRILQTSRKWRSDMGVADQDLTGKLVHEVFPGSRERWGAFLDQALAGKTIRAKRAQLVLPNGARPWVRSEITPWRNLGGRIGGLLIMTYDITDMVEALDKLRRSEETLKLALEIGELSMWEMDHRDRQLNNAGSNILNTTTELSYEAMERDIWFGIHPADRPAAMAAWERYEAEGEPFRAIFRMMRHDGPHVWLQSATEVIRDRDGQPERTVGVLRNIDKQKRSEMALAKARDAAEAANRAKSEFLANMSHEIRTPLNGVMGVASALTRTRLDRNQREMVGLIESSARTLEVLLSDVLDLARVESGRLELAHEPFDLQRCIADVGALFHPSAEARSLDLIVEPAPQIEGVFLGDAARIRQILSNLVANAVKFTPSGHVRLSASAVRTPEGIEARICVSDTGIGFDEETKARLFGRFEQADGSITRRFGGSGLGLAISRSLTERMGGELVAQATPGKGAVFTLTLPLTRAAEAPFTEAFEALAEEIEADAAPLRVLLAEDHPTNRRVVQLILESVGVDLTCVENGALAVEAWERGAFDLVLMDMQMPVMDGLTAIARIRELEARLGRPRALIHALTANAMPEHAKASKAAGADGHLTKPISAEELFRTVEAAHRSVSEGSQPQDAGEQAAMNAG